MSLPAGSRLGPYEILSPIGAGGMGEVYRAKDPRLKRDVAIKVLPASLSADTDRLRRFEQEAQAAGALNHPNITAVYDIGLRDGAPYVVQELLEGETLRSVLAEGKLAPRRAMDYAIQITQGLAAAHEKGIVHRDLKPENLFVTKDDRVKILDFGLAKLTHTEEGSLATSLPTATAGTEPGVVLGTLGYMAPEQVRGQSADTRSDIFSFGAILYEMLSGNRAFRGGSAADTMSAILKEDPPDLSLANQSISQSLERIVRHCLEKNPERRFQSARDLTFDLETVSGLSGPSAVTALPKAARRPGWLVPATLSALLATVAAASFVAGTRIESGHRASNVSFAQKSFEPQPIFVARFAPDGQTMVYSAAPEGNVPQLFSIRPEYPESRPLGLPQAHLLSISSQGELAVLTHAVFINHRLFKGTLARMPLGAGAPREILDNVREADWSPDGASLAMIHEVDGRDRLEFPIGKVLWQTAGYLSDPRVSPKGDRVAFFEHPARYDDRGLVAVVDRSGNRTVLSEGYAGEEGLAWSPKGDEVLFSGQVTSTAGGSAMTVYAVTLSGKRRVALESAGGLTIQDISRDGRWLVTRDDIRLSLLASAPGEKQERDLSWLDGSISPFLSGDGRTLLFTDQSWTGGAYYTVCLRKTDGSPVVRLGEGLGCGLSLDGAWALAIVSTTPQQLRIYPTGPGQPRILERGKLESYWKAAWFGDGRAVLACGNEPGHASRCYVQEVAGGPPRPLTPEGTSVGLPSPDGKLVLAFTGGKASLYPVAGGTPQPLPLLTVEDRVLRWSPDGRALWLWRRGSMPVRIEGFDLETGRREAIEEIAPRDRAGLLGIMYVSLADDPGFYVYNSSQSVSHLFVVEGAR